MISFSYNIDNFSLHDEVRVQKWISNLILSHHKRVGNIGYLFCDDEYLIQVNRTYLNHDTYTDIITFDYVAGDSISGDILISIERVRENAKSFQVLFEQELHRVLAHGVLHLLGQGDRSDEEAAQMRIREEKALMSWNLMK